MIKLSLRALQNSLKIKNIFNFKNVFFKEYHENNNNGKLRLL